MSTLSRLTARLAVVIPFAALLAAACNTDSNGPSKSALLADRRGGGGAATVLEGGLGRADGMAAPATDMALDS